MAVLSASLSSTACSMSFRPMNCPICDPIAAIRFRRYSFGGLMPVLRNSMTPATPPPRMMGKATAARNPASKANCPRGKSESWVTSATRPGRRWPRPGRKALRREETSSRSWRWRSRGRPGLAWTRHRPAGGDVQTGCGKILVEELVLDVVLCFSHLLASVLDVAPGLLALTLDLLNFSLGLFGGVVRGFAVLLLGLALHLVPCALGLVTGAGAHSYLLLHGRLQISQRATGNKLSG